MCSDSKQEVHDKCICTVRRPNLDDLNPMRSPVTADVLARTEETSIEKAEMLELGLEPLVAGTESYSAESTNEPASPSTTPCWTTPKSWARSQF